MNPLFAFSIGPVEMIILGGGVLAIVFVYKLFQIMIRAADRLKQD